MHGWHRRLKKLDEGVFVIERWGLLASVVVMITLVFIDVLQRTFSRPVGKTEQFMLWVATPKNGELAAETHDLIVGPLGTGIFGALSVLIVVAAVQSARNFKIRREQGDETLKAPFMKSVPVGVALFLIFWGAIELLLWAAPSGVPGAQRFALGLLVWSGMIGASMAVRVRRHIVLDAVKRKLSPEVAPIYAFLGGLLTSSFLLFLAYMGASMTAVEISEWWENDMAIHVYEALPIPTWLVKLAIPVCFSITALRFFFQGLGELLFGASFATGADEHGIDFEELQRAAAGKDDGPSEDAAAAGGVVMGRHHPGHLEPGQEQSGPGGAS